MIHLSLNGVPADAGVPASALVNYGHFTSLQVRGGAVQGLHLHLRRLEEATRALFGTALDPEAVRGWMRAALAAAGVGDASLRVTVFSQRFDFRRPLLPVPTDVLVAVSAPARPPAQPWRVRGVVYERDLPEIKHVGTFGAFAQRRQALDAGFDDALFVTRDGLVSEGTTWNLALLVGATVVWPQAPRLHGVTAQLLRGELGPDEARAVTVSELDGVQGAIACNATGIWPLGGIDGRELPGSGAFCRRARQALAAVPSEPL